jgi:hypothetical protein
VYTHDSPLAYKSCEATQERYLLLQLERPRGHHIRPTVNPPGTPYIPAYSPRSAGVCVWQGIYIYLFWSSFYGVMMMIYIRVYACIPSCIIIITLGENRLLGSQCALRPGTWRGHPTHSLTNRKCSLLFMHACYYEKCVQLLSVFCVHKTVSSYILSVSEIPSRPAPLYIYM